MSVCPLQQPIVPLLCQVICAPPAAVSNPINWNSAALSAPTAVASHSQGLLYNPALPWDVVLPPPQQGWGIHALPMSCTKCFFSPSSSSLPLCACGNSDKSAPCRPGWLGESREGEVTTSPTTPTPLCGTPGSGLCLKDKLSLQCPASKEESHSSNLLLKHHSCTTNLQQSQEYWGNPSKTSPAG